MRTSARVLASAGAVLVAALFVWAVFWPADRTGGVLIPRHLQNAVFEPPPPLAKPARVLAQVWSDLTHPATFHSLLPNQGGTIWLAIVVALVVAFNFRKPWHPRNVELLALLAIGGLLFNIMRFFDYLTDPIHFRVMDWVFGGIVAVCLFLLVAAIWRVRRPHLTPWRPNLGRRPLVALACLLLGLNVLTALATPPDDAGFYTNLGAQRLRERGMFPYGDPLLSNSAGSGYGPVLYLAHLPYQWLLNPQPLNDTAYDRADLAGPEVYRLPPPLATQLTTVTFHLIGVFALVAIGSRLANRRVGWGLAALYCGSVYVMGVGGDRELIGGMTFISHIAPAAVSLLAFAALARPLLAGMLLVAATATTFYPVLFAPAWIGYYWDDRAALKRFAAGLVIAGLAIGGPVLALSQPVEGRGLLGTVLHESVGHHQGGDTYGLSPFGFWGLRYDARQLFREPLLGGQFVTSPMFLMTGLLAALCFVLARRASPQQLALLTAALAIGAQVSKIHATAVYVTWFYPFLLIGFFTSGYGLGRDLRHRRSVAGVRPFGMVGGEEKAADTSQEQQVERAAR
jgi:hypothetical protein